MGIPAGKTRLLLEHFRIDEHHSNAHTVRKEMGAPQAPAPQRYARRQ